MRIFIFGAGASKGAQQGVVHDIAKAPLTNELFDIRYQNFADMVGLSEATMNNYRQQISGFPFFEDWLTKEWNDIKLKKETRTRDAQKGFLAQIAFYIWLLLINVSKWTYENQYKNRENNSYLVLMNKLLTKDEPFGLINFNYDLLLDFAYKDSHKLIFNNLDDYLNNNYVKPHGSVNWLLSKRTDDRDIDLNHEHNMDTRIRLDTAINLMFKDSPIPIEGVIVRDPNHRDLYTVDDILRSFGRQYFYPLMFLPLTSKEYSSISGFENKIMKKGRELLSESSEIYLIGYRANDEIIKNILALTPEGTKLNVVGNTSANSIMDNVLGWERKLVRGTVYQQGFHRFVYDITF